MPAFLRRIAPIALAVVVGVAGAWAALLLAGRLHYTLGPFDVELFARPGSGVTEIAIPPLGRVVADTHLAPVRLTVTLSSVDPDLANEAISRRGVRGLVLEVERRGLEALRTHAVRLLGIAALGAAIAAALVYRLRWRRAATATLAGALILGSLGGVAWATYRPSAFLEPTYTGSLRLAPGLVGPIREATNRIEDFRVELDRLVRGAVSAYGELAGAPAPTEDAVVVLHVSDIHGSPLGMDFAQRLAGTFDVDLVIDTGDITSFGTPPEQSIIGRIAQFRVPYVFVRGNHDSAAVGARVDAIGNAEVLEGEAVTVAGVTVFGAPHALFTPDRETTFTDEEIVEAVATAGEALAERVAALPDQPDVMAVHDDRMAAASAGLVPLVVAGHFHRPAAAVHSGTLFLRTGSTGGGGLDTFTLEEPVPLSAQLLYLDGGPPRLVAVDRVSLDPETRELVAERRLATRLLEGEPTPAPSPTATPSP